MRRAANLVAAVCLGLTGLGLTACATAPSAPTAAQRRALEGRVVVITGASSGFGRGMAIGFAQRGAHVVLAARRAELLEQVATEARQYGVRALPVATDVGSEADMQRLAAAAMAEFGHVDVWINNAGVGAFGRFDEIPLADHDRLVRTNLMGVIYGSHFAIRQFRQQGYGTLINMGSVNSRVPQPYYASYVATKHAIVGLDNSLRQELRLNKDKRIHVVTIEPWATDTPFFTHGANYTGHTPRHVLIDGPEKVVNAVVEAAVHPRKEVRTSWKAQSAVAFHHMAPGLTETLTANVLQKAQMHDAPAGVPPHHGAVQQPMSEGRGVEGGVRDRIRQENEAKKKPSS